MAKKKSIWINDDGKSPLLTARRKDVNAFKDQIILLLKAYKSFDNAMSDFSHAAKGPTVPHKYAFDRRQWNF